MVVARGAAPAAMSSAEGALVFVSEKHPRLMAPVASHHVRIAERGVRAKECRRGFLLVRCEIFTAVHSPGGFTYCLSVHFDQEKRRTNRRPLTRRFAAPSPRFAGRGISREFLRPACGEKVAGGRMR